MALLIYTVYGFSIFFFVFWSGLWLVHLIAICWGKWKLHRKANQLASIEVPYPGVSIIKPLVGVDPNLLINLETFFTMTYSLYELLFCINDESDPSIMLVKHLMEKYPQIDAKVFIGGEKVGVNPKINNMQPGYAASKYELILISDSGLRMKEDTLLDMVDHMTEKVGLVHQMPFTCDRDGFAAILEKVYFGTMQARMYLAFNFVGISCVTGMSTLIRKELLESIGGIKSFGCYLAEDFFITKSIVDRNWKLAICSQPAWQNSGLCEVGYLQTRIQRWAKLRMAMVPHTIILEPLSECVILGGCAAWAVHMLFQWDPIVFYLVHVLVWLLLDWLLLSVVQNGSVPFNKFEFVVGWLFREITFPYLFLSALFNPDIRWRTGVYRLKWGGVVEEVKPKVKV